MNRFAHLLVVGFALPMVACAGGSSPSMTAPSALADPTPSPGVTQSLQGIIITVPADVRVGVAAYFTLTVTGLSVELTLDWGDGTVVTGVGTVTQAVVSHVYAAAGSPLLTVTAKDGAGGVTAASAPVFVK